MCKPAVWNGEINAFSQFVNVNVNIVSIVMVMEKKRYIPTNDHNTLTHSYYLYKYRLNAEVAYN